jgi:hypothetical protein
VQHGVEPPPVAAFDRAGPGIGSGGLGMALQIEDVDDAPGVLAPFGRYGEVPVTLGGRVDRTCRRQPSTKLSRS